jgi:hypothetical protein
VQNCRISRLGADNAFAPGQLLKEYCRAEAMGDVTSVLSRTAVDKKQQNSLCRHARGADGSSLLDFQLKSAMSGLGNE